MSVNTYIFIDSIARSRMKHPEERQKCILLYLITILLSNSCSPEPNPGPVQNQMTHIEACGNPSSPSQSHSSWICGTCDLEVSWNDRGVVCDNCGQWFHGKCQSIDSLKYEMLNDTSEEWFCAICGSPNSKTAYDLHGVDLSVSSLHAADSTFGSHSTPTEKNFRPDHASTPTRASQQNKWKDRPLRILNINFQSASSKRAEIPFLLESLKPDVIFGSETRLNHTIKSEEIFPTCYEVFRTDRSGKSGGGALVAVHKSLVSYAAPELEVAGCEMAWACIKLKGRRTLYVCGFYRPDKSDESSLTAFKKSLCKAT